MPKKFNIFVLLLSVLALAACSPAEVEVPVIVEITAPPATAVPVDTAATEAAQAAAISAAVEATTAAQAAAEQAVADADAAAVDATGKFIVGGNYVASGECPSSTFLSVSADPANGAYPAPELNVTCDGTTVTVTGNGIPNFEFVQITPSDLTAATHQFQFPQSPALAAETTELPLLGAVAVAVNGMPIFGPNEAENLGYGDPFLDEILDFCNGHTGGGQYHFHAAPNCLFTDLNNSPGLVVAYALDGFPIVAPVICGNADCSAQRVAESTWDRTNDVKDAWAAHTVVPGKSELDECNGLVLDDGSYVYFATATFPYFLGCYRGTTTLARQGNGDGNGANGANGAGTGGPDFAAAAGTLGITEDALRDALGGPPPNIDAAVVTLGISREVLVAALVAAGFNLPTQLLEEGSAAAVQDALQGDFVAAANALGVTEEQLRTALGTTAPPNLEAAAALLGVNREALVAAMLLGGFPVPGGAGGLIPQVGGNDN